MPTIKKCLNSSNSMISYEPHHGKFVFGVSDQFQHKPDCTTTEDGLKISDLGSRGIVLSM